MMINENSKIKPADIIEALEKENIEARHIWKPMHMQPYYEKFEFFNHNEEKEDQKDISVSEKIFERGLCLPSDTKMNKEEQEEVIRIIKKLFK